MWIWCSHVFAFRFSLEFEMENSAKQPVAKYCEQTFCAQPHKLHTALLFSLIFSEHKRLLLLQHWTELELSVEWRVCVLFAVQSKCHWWHGQVREKKWWKWNESEKVTPERANVSIILRQIEFQLSRMCCMCVKWMNLAMTMSFWTRNMRWSVTCWENQTRGDMQSNFFSVLSSKQEGSIREQWKFNLIQLEKIIDLFAHHLHLPHTSDGIFQFTCFCFQCTFDRNQLLGWGYSEKVRDMPCHDFILLQLINRWCSRLWADISRQLNMNS